MTPSTTLQLKISKMKKRLSSNAWQLSLLLITIFGFFGIIIFSLRLISLPGDYGIVRAELPVVLIPFSDPTYHEFVESFSSSIEKTTPAIVISSRSFYFGELQSFSEDLLESRNKFSIPHLDGEPQFNTLLNTMRLWISKKEIDSKGKFKNDGTVVLIPSSEIPASIVIQIIMRLRSSELFNRVILSGGLR